MIRLLVSALLLAPAAFAQHGTVTYDVTTRLDVQLPPEMQHLAAQMPTSRTAQRVLLFDGSAAITRDAPRAEAASVEAGPGIRMSFQQAESVLYVDLAAGTRIQQTGFLGRTFLVSGEVPRLAWRLTGEQGEFLGYPCQKAVAMRDSLSVEAWFAPGIPASVGPDGYGGLPGLILVVTEDGGRRTFVAREVSLDPPGALAPPTEGRPVSREEYDRIVREKLDEMEAERGPGGVSIIRMGP